MKDLGYKVIAVDFDGCLCTNSWPEIGLPNMRLIEILNAARKSGNKVILWTCREGKPLEDAVSWCDEHGLHFDAVNDNIPEMNELFNNNSRKIGADIYIDDKAMMVKCPHNDFWFWADLADSVVGRDC